MKKGKVLSDNRGSALLSVMIAVSFITILASTLLYMSYTNFSTKAMNAASKQNFYKTEESLTELSAELRNATNGSANPDTDLETLLNVTTAPGDIKRYDLEKIALLAFPGETATVTGNTAIVAPSGTDSVYQFTSAVSNASEANFLVDTSVPDIKTITLKGIKVEKTDVTEGYENTIETDIVLKYKIQTSGNNDVNMGDFSILSDAGVQITGEDTYVNIYGSVFLGKDSASSTVFQAGGESQVNILGDHVIIAGDVVLDDRAVLNITGSEVIVLGKIILNGNSALLCNGSLRFPPNTTAFGIEGNTTNIFPINPTITRMTDDEYNELLKLLNYDGHDASAGQGVLPLLLTTQTVDSISFSYNQVKDEKTVSGMFCGETLNTKFFKTNPVNCSQWHNSLVFFVNDGNTPIKFLDGTGAADGFNSTVLSCVPLIITNTKTMNFTQLGNQEFNYLTFKDSGNTNVYDPSIHEITMNMKDASGNAINEPKKFIIGDFIHSNASLNLNKLINAASAGGSHTTSSSTVYYENWEKE